MAVAVCCRPVPCSETYQYYTLPFCQHKEGKKYVTEDLGEVLEGDRLVNTPYDIRFRQDVDSQVLCTKKLTGNDLFNIRMAIAEDYYFQVCSSSSMAWSGLAQQWWCAVAKLVAVACESTRCAASSSGRLPVETRLSVQERAARGSCAMARVPGWPQANMSDACGSSSCLRRLQQGIWQRPWWWQQQQQLLSALPCCAMLCVLPLLCRCSLTTTCLCGGSSARQRTSRALTASLRPGSTSSPTSTLTSASTATR